MNPPPDISFLDLSVQFSYEEFQMVIDINVEDFDLVYLYMTALWEKESAIS